MVGLAIAYNLACKGLNDVVVLEGSYLAGGASGRNGGGIRQQWSTALNVELMRELRSSNASAGTVGELVSKDLAISAKLIQVANSAFMGLEQQVSEPAAAVLQLGLETTASLVLSIEAFARFHVLAGANPGIVKTLDDKRIEVTCRNHRLQRRSRFLVHPGARQLEGTLRIRLPESTATEKQKR